MSNLITQEDKKAILKQYRMRFITLAFVCLALLALVSCALLLPSLFLSKTSIVSLESKKDSYGQRETSELEKSLSDTTADINTKLASFADMAPVAPLTASMLDPILSARGDGIRLTMFTFTLRDNDPKTADIQVSGIAADRASLLDFGKRLQTVPGMTNVSVPITSFIKNQNVGFTISLLATLK